MTVHLIKLCVGPDSLADLAQWQQQHIRQQTRRGQTPELMHITRHHPKRSEELLNGGSIYWVVKGMVTARQTLLELRPVTYNGTQHCALVYAPQLIKVRLQPRRPFQGWRYLKPEDAPADIGPWTSEEGADTLERELAELGLA